MSRKHFFRYLFVGVTTIVVDVAVLTFCKEILDIKLEVATSISYWLSIAYNFSMNRWWTFSAQETKSLSEHAVFYGMLLFINYIYTVLFVSILSRFMYYGFAKIIVIAVAVSWTYPLYKYVIFKKSAHQSI